jgi:hypothetical protein
MAEMMYRLDLPPPDPDIIKFCIDEVLGTLSHLTTGTWPEQYKSTDIPADSIPAATFIHLFKQDSFMFNKINSQYKDYFKKPVKPAIVMFSNRSKQHKFASLVPHCDVNRTFSLNYVIEPGGENVTTTFYKEAREDPDLEVIQFKHPDELTLLNSYVCPKNGWTMLNVQQYHGVDNIENNRIVLMLMSLNNFDRSVDEIFNELEHLATPLDTIK